MSARQTAEKLLPQAKELVFQLQGELKLTNAMNPPAGTDAWYLMNHACGVVARLQDIITELERR